MSTSATTALPPSPYDEKALTRDAALFLQCTATADPNPWSLHLHFPSTSGNPSGRDAKEEDMMMRGLDLYASDLRVLAALHASLLSENARYTTTNLSADANDDLNTSARLYHVTVDVFASSLPYVWMLGRGQLSSPADSSFKQLTRDVERDCYVFNGAYMFGSKLGIEAVIASIVDYLNAITIDSGVPCLPASVSRALTEHILKTASRTNSGGATFQTLQECLDPATSLVIPASRRASPLQISLSIGTDGVGKSGRPTSTWGIICDVVCCTVFTVCSQAHDIGEDSGESPRQQELPIAQLSVEGVYETRLFYGLEPGKEHAATVLSLRESVRFIQIDEDNTSNES